MEEKKPNQCVVDGCELTKYVFMSGSHFDEPHEYSQCILHCTKDDFFTFNQYEDFVNCLINSPFFAIKNNVVKINNVVFPNTFNSVTFDNFYDSALSYAFSNCFFDCYDVKPNSTFNDCEFSHQIGIETHILPTISFNNCSFKGDLVLGYEEDNIIDLTNLSFSSCDVEEVYFRNINFNSDHFLSFSFKALKVAKFSYCTFSFSQELHDITSVYFTHCRFNHEVIFNCSILKSLHLLECIFNGNCKLVELPSLNSLVIELSQFKAFFSIISIDFNFRLTFTGSDFLGLISFENVILRKGFDFNSCIIKSNFYIANTRIPFTKESHKDTPRETYRAIKFAFDNIGNTVEANKYFALEIDKLYSELSWRNNFSEKLLLSINKYTSNFGQNWWLPILWIFGFASLFYALRQYDPFDSPFLNGIASFIIPYQGIIGTTHQMSKLLTSILFGVLIYQTTVALKRKTRR
ncbi:MAG: hypothetical protein AB7F25_12945 [Deferribacterales bacterium]